MKFLEWLRNSFEDSTGKADASKITAFMAFLYIIISAVIDQVWGKAPTEFIFLTIAGLATAGLGFGSLPAMLSKKKNQNENNN
ncbi:MAG: hypothetical protein ACK40G_17320 [Cytophagaceae bacterium]